MSVAPSGRVVVIGAGPAGLTAALTAARAGARVRVLAKGWGTLYWNAGCVDVLDAGPDSDLSPRRAIEELVEDHPGHPYAVVGLDAVEAAIADVAATCAEAGYELVGSLDHTLSVLTGVGGVRRTCLAPSTMAAGAADQITPTLVVGFTGYPDLTASLVADNLEHRGIPCRPVTIQMASLDARRFVTAAVLAQAFERPEFRSELVALLQPKIGRAARVGFPAVLGHDAAPAVVADLEQRLGVDVFELPVVPPSIPGMRIHRILRRAIESAGGRVYDGMEALDVVMDDDDIVAVETESAGRRHRTRGDVFVLATGGILGGGIVGDEDGTLREVVVGLDVEGPSDRTSWMSRDFDDDAGHPVFRAGIQVDEALRPVAARRADNLFVAGSLIAGADPVRERSVDGIAYATGRLAGELAATQALEGGTT